ncbi:MAG: anti-sigma factor domain-containing protein [Actinomycetota bacterium]
MTLHDPGGEGAMPPDHERIEQLLAAHTLNSLDGEDQRDAERLLTEHLPGCERCREMLPVFRTLVAELALASLPVDPPDTLLPRLRREIQEAPWLGKGPAKAPRRGVGSWLAAAAAIAVVGLTVWNVTLHARVGDISSRQQRIAAVTHLMAQPDARTVALDSERSEHRVLLGYREAQVALFGSDVPAPASGHVYRLWVGESSHFRHVVDFVPEEGLVTVLLGFDASRYDEILITEEPSGSRPTVPTGPRRWSAELTPKFGNQGGTDAA